MRVSHGCELIARALQPTCHWGSAALGRTALCWWDGGGCCHSTCSVAAHCIGARGKHSRWMRWEKPCLAGTEIANPCCCPCADCRSHCQAGLHWCWWVARGLAVGRIQLGGRSETGAVGAKKHRTEQETARIVDSAAAARCACAVERSCHPSSCSLMSGGASAARRAYRRLGTWTSDARGGTAWATAIHWSQSTPRRLSVPSGWEPTASTPRQPASQRLSPQLCRCGGFGAW